MCDNLHIFLICKFHATGHILPKEIEIEVLQSVVVLLVKTYEASLIYHYLQPLDGYVNVFKFNQFGQRTQLVTYYIGKCGACPGAIRFLPPGFTALDNASTVLKMADQCFPNLGAIISVGVACGIQSKVKLCDVLVSSKVINYGKATYEHHGYLPKHEAITMSSHLLKLFAQPVQWPNDKIKKNLTDNGLPMPNMKYGTILSGPNVVDDPTIRRLIKNFTDEAIGIEMDGAHLFAENHPITTNTIIVKAVYKFVYGNSFKMYESIASSLAVDLVQKSLSDPQVPEILKG